MKRDRSFQAGIDIKTGSGRQDSKVRRSFLLDGSNARRCHQGITQKRMAYDENTLIAEWAGFQGSEAGMHMLNIHAGYEECTRFALIG